MKIITDPSRQITAWAGQTRDAEHQKPSKKQQTPDGGKLFWLPLQALDNETEQSLELIAFATKPVPVRALDLVRLDGAHLMNVFGGSNGSQPVGMYYFDDVEVVGNMLDALEETTRFDSGLKAVADE